MPSKNPRLSVVLSPSLAATLAALAHATDESASSLVRGILEQSEGALLRMLQLVTAAKAAKGEIGGGVSASLDKVVADLEDAMAVADFRMGRVERDLVDAAEVVGGRRRTSGAAVRAGERRGARGAAEAVPTPVPVTRGSGPGKTRRTEGRKGGRHGSV
jgi:hypothetical protein